jgi:hypothetical protein
VIGLLFLCFLPHANAPELPEWEQRDKQERGNRIGRNIALVNLLLVLVNFWERLKSPQLAAPSPSRSRRKNYSARQ